MKGVEHYKSNGTLYTGLTHKMPDGSLHTGSEHSKASVPLFHADEQIALAKGLRNNSGGSNGY
tara:strand:- start:636 stop:824 length:189 start_codon:yes stop_codon:yes gene_type:complete